MLSYRTMANSYRLTCPRCRLTYARYDFCCLLCHLEVRRPVVWDFAKAYRQAQQRIADAAGVPLEAVMQADGDHVARARKGAEMAAPALLRLQLGLTLGTSPEELDRVRGGARLMLESIKQLHAVVGLRAGEEVDIGLSERMQGFLTKWQERRGELPEATRVIEADVGEAGRRLRAGDAADSGA